MDVSFTINMIIYFFFFSLQLLAKEIRQERNKILQCVHYIVKKNFFGVGKSIS